MLHWPPEVQLGLSLPQGYQSTARQTQSWPSHATSSLIVGQATFFFPQTLQRFGRLTYARFHMLMCIHRQSTLSFPQTSNRIPVNQGHTEFPATGFRLFPQWLTSRSPPKMANHSIWPSLAANFRLGHLQMIHRPAKLLSMLSTVWSLLVVVYWSIGIASGTFRINVLASHRPSSEWVVIFVLCSDTNYSWSFVDWIDDYSKIMRRSSMRDLKFEGKTIRMGQHMCRHEAYSKSPALEVPWQLEVTERLMLYCQLSSGHHNHWPFKASRVAVLWQSWLQSFAGDAGKDKRAGRLNNQQTKVSLLL